MQIRSVTLGVSAQPAQLPSLCRTAGAFLTAAGERLSAAGFPVQTLRLCTQPAHEATSPVDFPAFARDLEAGCGEAGIDYCAAGGILVGGAWAEPAASDAVHAAIVGTERFFSSIQLAVDGSVQWPALRAAARTISAIARSTDQGFGNLRFAASANCPPNVPFFPVAYHRGDTPRFAIAVQWADRLLEAARGEDSLDRALARITASLDEWGGRVQAVAEALATEHGVEYVGLDLSPAPFPTEPESVAAAVEALGVDRFGGPGSLSAIACLSAALRRSRLKRAGFSGVMLPVLEDSVLARRAGGYSVSELLLYSAVCGTGLDTVPLPGDVTDEELAAMLADVASLALALDKPLTARLLPVPSAASGQMTAFAFPFFANGPVFPARGVGAGRLIDRGGRTDQ